MFELPITIAGQDCFANLKNELNKIPQDKKINFLFKSLNISDDEWNVPIGDSAISTWRDLRNIIGIENTQLLVENKLTKLNQFKFINSTKFEEFRKKFGFKLIKIQNCELKNWVNKIPEMEKSLLAIADILKIEPQNIGNELITLQLNGSSLDGKYDPLNKTIIVGGDEDITTSFVHEWFHALDHQLGEKLPNFGAPGLAPKWLSENIEIFPQLNIPLWERIDQVWDVWSKSWLKWSGSLPGELANAGTSIWGQCERMFLRGAGLEQSLKPMQLFLTHLGDRNDVDFFKNWINHDMDVPYNIYTWAGESLDKKENRDEPYWGKKRELFARAAHNWIFNKLKNSSWGVLSTNDPVLYPTKKTSKEINKYFDILWEEWKLKVFPKNEIKTTYNHE
jgi:hypothetical protein